MILVCVVVTPDLQKLEALVDDQNGKIRRITLIWKGKDPMPVPEDWYARVEAEARDRMAADYAKSIGRVIM